MPGKKLRCENTQMQNATHAAQGVPLGIRVRAEHIARRINVVDVLAHRAADIGLALGLTTHEKSLGHAGQRDHQFMYSSAAHRRATPERVFQASF